MRISLFSSVLSLHILEKIIKKEGFFCLGYVTSKRNELLNSNQLYTA